METEIGHIGYTLKLSTLPSHFLENIRQELYVKPLENPNFPTNESAYPVFRISKSKIYIPRYYGIEKYGQPLKNNLPSGESIDLEFVGTIRPIQQETIDATLKIGSGLISLDTGLGKTVVALKLISLLSVKTLIFVHADFLLDQWIERIKQYLPSARIGVIKQDKCEIENVDITICMIQTFTKREYPKDTFKSYGQMIIDECFPYRQLISTSQGPMRIGSLYNKWNNKEILPLVLSFNELTQQTEYKKIIHAWKKQNENLLKINYSKSNIKCTENHKILTPEGYIEANKLNIGDLIKCNYIKLNETMVAQALNEDQYQIFLGSYLGDGHIAILPSERYRLTIIHCEKQKEYCEWKASMFGCNIKKIENNGYAKGIAYTFNTKIIDLPLNKTLTKNYKHCPQWILDELDYRGLAIWWMDDGSLSKIAYAGTLSTCSFDEETHIRFIEKFKKLDIDCTYRSDGHGFLSIYFNKKGIYSLFKKIRPYLHENLKYKFYNILLKQATEQFFYGTLVTVYTDISNINPTIIKETNLIKVLNNNRYINYLIKKCNICGIISFHTIKDRIRCCNCRTNYKENFQYFEPPKNYDLYKWNNQFLNYGTVKITSIEKIKNKEINVYDIEVEDNHNFICCAISGIGPIVHNCHHLGSKTFSSIFFKVQTKFMIGLSATPERKDGLSKVIYWFLGPQIIHIKRDTDKPKIKFIFNDTTNYTEKFNRLGKINNPEMITDLTIKKERNELIISNVKKMLTENRKILIISDRRGHCEYLLNALKELNISCGLYLGGMKTADREISVNCSVIIGTYQASGEGFDVPELDTLILASPKSNVEQAVGRILRQKNKNEPIVLDIIDSFSIFKGQYYKRRKFYKLSGFAII